MKNIIKLSALSVLFGVSASSFAAFGVNTGVSTDTASQALSSKASVGDTKDINEIINLNINDQSDQVMWSNFVKNCMLPELSHDQIASLATGGVSGINKFLTSFTPQQSAMTMAYNKLVSCPDAKPAAKKLLEKLSTAQVTKSKSSLW
ncbi:hypothetical protein L3V83_03490 [Thiotrichales bacterium 19X7-9]|nr:hypothetical protein [Thiotrichales bacterium 19X7-9]